MKRTTLACAIALLATLTVWSAYASESGRISRVYGATFASTYTLYTFAPELLVGWNGPLRGYEKKYIAERYQNLPVLGGWYGQGFIPDREKLLSAGIDAVLLLTSDTGFSASIEKSLTAIGLSVVAIPGEYMRQYPDMFRSMGKAFSLPERGNMLGEYAVKTLDKMAPFAVIPEEQRLRVYIGLETDGLGTVCAESSRSESLEMAGGRNVHTCAGPLNESTTRVSFEQVMTYDPDVVLILHPSFIERFADDRKWRNLRAVRDGRIYLVPHEPFCWLDKPMTFMRLIGVQWLAATLYPDRYTGDIGKDTQEFMSVFFERDLDGHSVETVLRP